MTFPPLLRHPVRLSAFALVLAATAVFAFAAPASAHDQLVGAEPAADTTVEVSPAEIVLTYSAEILPEGAEVQVTDAAGTSLAEGEPVIAGTTLTQPLAGDASGAVTVLWRVVSSDGHPISGEYGFTVAAAAPTTPPTDPTPTPTPTDTSSAMPTATAPVGVEPSPTESAPSSDSSPLPWIIGGVIALVVIGAVIAVLVARPRGTGGAGSSSDG